MTPRIAYVKASPDTYDAISKVAAHLAQTFPDPKLKALVELRVSQINGCAFCLDLHSNQARALGEAQQRLDCLSAWREVSFYTEKERAALAWAEAITLVSETHVPDDVYDEVKKHFSEKEVVDLTAVIGVMNLWNRLSISFRAQPREKPARG